MYDLQDNEAPHRFPLAYKIRKRSVFRLAKRSEKKEPHTGRRYMPLRRLALIMAIVAAVVVLSIGAYAAYVLFINGFAFDVYKDHSELTLDPSMYEIKDTITEYYFLPPESGCEYVSDIIDDDIVMTEYQLNGKMVNLMQYAGINADNFFVLNTENSDLYEAKISENDGFINIVHREGKDDGTSIFWVMDGYLFHISTIGLSKDELVKMAEFVTKKY